MPTGLSLYPREKPVAGGAAVADFAEVLLKRGVLRESDWTGDVGTSIERGLHRWVNEELGAKDLNFLAPLRLIYTNDARRYFLALDDSLWRREMKALQGRPLGFFALSWQKDHFTPIFVAEKIKELEAVWPGLGYGLLDMLGFAFRWSCNGWGFDETFGYAEAAEQRLKEDWLDEQLQYNDPDDFDDLGRLKDPQKEKDLEDYWEQMLQHEAEEKGLDTHLTTLRYHDLIPEQTHTTRLNVDLIPQLCRDVEGITFKGFEDGRTVGARRQNNAKRTAAQRAKRRYAPIVQMILDLVQMIDRSSRTHIGVDHLPLIYNGGRQMARNPSVYLAWHPEDETHRIMDDVNGAHPMARQSDLVWLHGFQLDFAGRNTMMDTRFRNMLSRHRPDLRDTIKDTFQFEPDGSLEFAIRSVEHCVRMCVLVDKILTWLHSDKPFDREWEGYHPPMRLLMGGVDPQRLVEWMRQVPAGPEGEGGDEGDAPEVPFRIAVRVPGADMAEIRDEEQLAALLAGLDPDAQVDVALVEG